MRITGTLVTRRQGREFALENDYNRSPYIVHRSRLVEYVDADPHTLVGKRFVCEVRDGSNVVTHVAREA